MKPGLSVAIGTVAGREPLELAEPPVDDPAEVPELELDPEDPQPASSAKIPASARPATSCIRRAPSRI
jgi:hypothetical protein